MTDDHFQHECYRLITDLWKTLKPVTAVENTDDYYEKSLNSFSALYEMYKETAVAGFAKDLGVACINALDARRKVLFGGFNDANES